MKYLLILCLFGISPLTFAGDFRIFTDYKGREIKAKILKVDPLSDRVALEQRHGIRAAVFINLLSKADQVYIRSWAPDISKQRFKMNLARQTVPKSVILETAKHYSVEKSDIKIERQEGPDSVQQDVNQQDANQQDANQLGTKPSEAEQAEFEIESVRIGCIVHNGFQVKVSIVSDQDEGGGGGGGGKDLEIVSTKSTSKSTKRSKKGPRGKSGGGGGGGGDDRSDGSPEGWVLLTSKGQIKYDSFKNPHPVEQAYTALSELNKNLTNKKHINIQQLKSEFIAKTEPCGIPTFGLEAAKDEDDICDAAEEIIDWLSDNGAYFDSSEPYVFYPSKAFSDLHKNLYTLKRAF